MNLKKFNEVCDILAEHNDVIFLEDGECVVNGTEINAVRKEETWDGDVSINFYTTEKDEDGELEIGDEISLTNAQVRKVYDFIISYY